MSATELDAAEPTLIGSVGTTDRAWVSPWGDVARAGDSATLQWFVAAEDRWHVEVWRSFATWLWNAFIAAMHGAK